MKKLTLLPALMFLLCSCSDNEKEAPMPNPIPDGHYLELVTTITANQEGNYIGNICATGKDIIIDWGDGMRELLAGETAPYFNCDHKYNGAGPYKIKIQTDELEKLYIGDAIGVLPERVEISSCPKLDYLDFSLQPATSFTIRNCPVLTELHVILCNNLTALDISDCANLYNLRCESNASLANIDLSHNSKLAYLTITQNKLTDLDLSHNTALEFLVCGYNKLPSVDVSKQTILKHLDCTANKITQLDLENNPELTFLGCSLNEGLTELDLSPCKKLTFLYCNFNNMKALDISNNIHLQDIRCESNPLKTFNLTQHKELAQLFCGKCELTTLDISNKPNIRVIDCHDNKMEKEALEAIFEAVPDYTTTGKTRSEIIVKPKGSLSIKGNPGFEKYSVESYNKFTKKGWLLTDPQEYN